MPSRFRSVVSWIVLSLATWVLLAFVGWSAYGKSNETVYGDRWIDLAFFTSLALVFGWLALKSASRMKRWARVVFWTPAAPGIGFLGLALWNDRIAIMAKCEHPYLAFTTFLFLLGSLWICVRACRSDVIRLPFGQRIKAALCGWPADATMGAVCAVIIAAFIGFGWIWKVYYDARSINQKALARWAEIGRPMPEFEKKLTRVEENTSFKELLNDLKPFGVVSLYKAQPDKNGGLPEDQNELELSEEIVALLGAHQPADQIDAPTPKVAYLDQHAEELSRLYENILRREAPVWAQDFAAPFDITLPNYLAVRKLSQLISADARYRIANGDQAGAAAALKASLKLSENLDQQPLLVTCMIKVAINALFAKTVVCLPEDPQAWERLAKDASAGREQFLHTLQSEVLWGMHVVKYPSSVPCYQPYPQWAAKPFLRLEVAKNSSVLADQVGIYQGNQDLTRGDLGEREFEKWEASDPNIMTPNYVRAYSRVNLTLLLREQAEMIRFARTRIQEGTASAEHASVVIPGAKWVMTGDLATNSATLKLSPIPEWAKSKSYVDESFFLLPLDGSKSWKFATAAEKK